MQGVSQYSLGVTDIPYNYKISEPRPELSQYQLQAFGKALRDSPRALAQWPHLGYRSMYNGHGFGA